MGRDVFLLQNAVERVDGEAALRAYRGPLLVACGAQDALTPPDDHRAMAEQAPGARLIVIEDCGHMAPMERPDDVARALREWLRAPATPGAIDTGPVP
jgi:pimeloyl-ACP methyl ester carboxylesterase